MGQHTCRIASEGNAERENFSTANKKLKSCTNGGMNRIFLSCQKVFTRNDDSSLLGSPRCQGGLFSVRCSKHVQFILKNKPDPQQTVACMSQERNVLRSGRRIFGKIHPVGKGFPFENPRKGKIYLDICRCLVPKETKAAIPQCGFTH